MLNMLNRAYYNNFKPIRVGVSFFTVKGLWQLEAINENMERLQNSICNILNFTENMKKYGYAKTNPALQEYLNEYNIYSQALKKKQTELISDLSNQLGTDLNQYIQEYI